VPRTAQLLRMATAGVLTAAATLAAAAAPAAASNPADSGTLTPSSTDGTVTAAWTGAIAGANAFSDCSQSLDDSLNDHHTFTLAVPAGLYPGHTVRLSVTEAAEAADSILTVFKDGKALASSDSSGAGGTESFTMTDPGPGKYDAVTCSFAGASPYSALVTLVTSGADTSGVVGGTSTTAPASTYGNYSLASVPGADSSGEPSIGVDYGTGHVFFQSNLNTIKAIFPAGSGAPALSDVSCAVTAQTTLDPILFADSITGRVGVSQLAANPLALNSITNFFDAKNDPGASQANCIPSTGGGEVQGPDHQSLGGGAYPKPAPAGAGATGYPHAFYYCSQTIVSGALCSRSDNGGVNFNNGTPPYTSECGGLHGHLRVGPAGTVYLPNKSCGQTQGVAVSTDGVTTWKLKPVTGSTPGPTDPSVAADRAGNVFFGYVNGDGTPAISVSSDNGDHWSTPVKVGDALGIRNAVFSEVIAGDAGRAAYAFLGSPTGLDSQGRSRDNVDFGKNAAKTAYVDGEFHMYVATTVDGGQTYKTVDITPSDPVQRGSICTAGTTCMGGTRNLLDFNDITVDKDGRVLVGYADGCTGACTTSALVSDNSHSAVGTIARQIDGPLLFAPAGVDQPSQSVPEVPVPVLLPLTGLLLLAGMWTLRHRRFSRA